MVTRVSFKCLFSLPLSLLLLPALGEQTEGTTCEKVPSIQRTGLCLLSSRRKGGREGGREGEEEAHDTN